MKKLFLAVALVMVICSGVYAADAVWIPSTGEQPTIRIATDAITLLSAVTATGTGTAYDLKYATSQSTCTVTWGGTTPTNTVVALEGSIDNSTYAALATVTVTATGTMWHTVNKPVRYIRGNYVSKSGGDGTTAVTMVCVAGGN